MPTPAPDRPLRIMSVVGARPNMMKLAPFAHALAAHAGRLEHCIVHTGQHYDHKMSQTFFESLGIPPPDVDLGVGSGTHAEQVGRTMIEFEEVVRQRRPDWVVVIGDVNATAACAITAKKEHLRCAHIEAGLRSFDMDMPEEINRLVTDRLSAALFTPDAISDANLRAEGVPPARIHCVGNIMIDTLERNREQAARLDPAAIVRANAGDGVPSGPLPPLADDAFAAVTLHRPSNVDDPAILGPLVDFFVDELTRDMPLIWPIHPRTRKQLETFGLAAKVRGCRSILLTEPLGYHDMLRLNMGARVMFTDSGGLQEECCVLGTPCLTLRWNTERPVTLVEQGGVSLLVGNDLGRIREAYRRVKDQPRTPRRPPLWDGHTAERIAAFFAAEHGSAAAGGTRTTAVR